jgi:hypothetical protein
MQNTGSGARCASYPPLLAVGLLTFLASPAAAVPDPFLERLVDINTVLVAVAPFPDPPSGAPCLLDEGPLERRALEVLRAAGLRALGRAEVNEINHRADTAVRRGLQSLREGRLIQEAEARRRLDDIEFVNNTPRMVIRLATAPVEVGGMRICALTADSIVTVQAPNGMRLPVTGRMFMGGLRIWERQARVFSAPEAALADLAGARVEDIVSGFIRMRRRANGR